MYRYLQIAFTACFVSLGSLAGSAAGGLAFVGFNADGDDDFAVVLLSDTTNQTFFFTDNPLDGVGGFGSTEGIIQWDTGIATIAAGTVITFTDTDSDGNALFGASIGSLTMPDAGMTLAAGGDSIVAYQGSDLNTPTSFLAGIENLPGAVGDLTGSGLVAGTNLLNFSAGAHDDGGVYSGARTGTASALAALVNNPVNWTTSSGDGESLLPFDSTMFTVTTVPEPSAFLFLSLFCGMLGVGTLKRKWCNR